MKVNADSPQSPILRLALELRQQIYRHVLPNTFLSESRRVDACREEAATTQSVQVVGLVDAPCTNRITSLLKDRSCLPAPYIIWARGSTAILAVNRQIHDEAIPILYGENTFRIALDYDNIVFSHTSEAENELQLQRAYDFPLHFSHANLGRLRKIDIVVAYHDPYTSSAKFNCGQAGQIMGLLEQLETFVHTLQDAGVGLVSLKLRELRIQTNFENRVIVLDSGNGRTASESGVPPSGIFEPLGKLRAIRATVRPIDRKHDATLLAQRIMSDSVDEVVTMDQAALERADEPDPSMAMYRRAIVKSKRLIKLMLSQGNA